MTSPLQWIDQQTGIISVLDRWLRQPIAGGPAWRNVWPATIAFALLVQAITGLAIWMYYVPAAQSAWESVYYLQYHVAGGWLLRAIHFYTGQATLVLVGVYLVQMIFRAAYAAKRTMLFWTVLGMGLVTLGLNLTGDLLPWDQNSYWATGIRVAYLSHTPIIGSWLSKLAVGGTQFGSFTLTRFLVFHIGVFTAALAGLILLHAHIASRRSMEEAAASEVTPYWPRQAWRDAAACLVVAAVILGLSLRNGASAPHAGVELGAPANPVDDPGTARPEWSFRGLYQLHETLAAWPEIVSIMVIPGLTVLVFFLMPWIGRNRLGRTANVVITVFVLGSLAALTWHSYAADAKNEKYQAALQAGREQADRVKAIIVQPGSAELEKGDSSDETPRIPVSGALTLLQNDPLTQGPRLFNQYCASCHDYSGPALGGIVRPEKPTAADLSGFGRPAWLEPFLTVEGISSSRFFGNTKFRRSKMYGFVRETFSDFDAKEKKQIIAALSNEAQWRAQAETNAASQSDIAAGAKLIGENCVDCHSFHGKGTTSGPLLTGYGSRAWLLGIIGNPGQKRYYGKNNDRMPAFAESDAEPHKNILGRHELEMLVDWLRAER